MSCEAVFCVSKTTKGGVKDPELSFDTGSRRKQAAGQDNTFPFSQGQSPSEAQVELMAMKMMEQACYAAQYRLRDADRYIKKYEKDPRFRIAFAFEQLDDWDTELGFMYSYVSNWTREPPHHFRILQHILYYTHAARKMVDVTYTKEHILQLTNMIRESNTQFEDMVG